MVLKDVKKKSDYSWLNKSPISRRYEIEVYKNVTTRPTEKMTYEEAIEAIKKNKMRYPGYEFTIKEIG